MNFGPNVISATLLMTLCQKPHSKIPHRSRTVISLGGHDLGSLTLVQGHHKKSGNESCVSFGEVCICECFVHISSVGKKTSYK